MPKVSVIIPVYNVETYLRECIDSVINQTFKDIEIICVDDCGQDNSIKIAEEYVKKDKRIRIIKHDSNKGLAISRNTGLKEAKGEYIYFLDSDDYLNLNILEKLYEKITKSNSDIVCSDTAVFADGEKTEKVINKTKGLTNYFSSKNYVTDFQVNIGNISESYDIFSVISCGKLFSKSFIDKNKLSFVNNKLVHEDDGFWAKILSCQPKISTINEIGFFYRIHAGSIVTSMKDDRNGTDLKKCLLESFEYIKRTHSSENSRKIISTIKKCKPYYKYFGIKIPFLFKYLCGEKDKRIRILGISIYSEHSSDNLNKTIKICGINVKK